MRDTDGAWKRPRGQAWGNEAQRAVLHALAEDIARRSGHRVAVVEALRSDGNFEFVAIAGSPDGHEHLMGEATPLQMIDHMVAVGTHVDGWVHLPVDRIDSETRTFVDQYGHTPDVPEGDGPDGWHPEDLLFRLLTNGDGDLRAVLWLDEPHSGRRPTPEGIAGINAEVGAMYDAIVGIVERELYGEQVRMVTQARTAIRSVPPGLGLPDFLSRTRDAMVEAMAVDTVDVLLAGDSAPPLEGQQPVLEEHMRQVWLRRGHLVLEPDLSWGVTDTAVPTPPIMRDLMEQRGIASWLLVPIGLGEEYLGTMGLGRSADGPRWIDSEINAAAAVASDLAGVVVDARLIDRERALNAELRGLNDHRRDMMQTLAHELRNPVSVLFTHLELVAMEDRIEDARDSLAALGRATRRIEDMVEDLMALASVSDTDHDLLVDEVDVSELVRESTEFLAPTAAASHVEVSLDVEEGLVLPADGDGLQRMVTNLLSNAVKYTPSGGRVSVSVSRWVEDGHDGVRIVCSDSGIGIDPEEVQRIFEPFYRSRHAEARARPGTGLGLAIIERVVTRHRGSVRVDSTLGEGTTFTVWLPMAGPDDVR
ncbi:signal transduction histidine kinase [Nocardioides cavernae]|uniref:Sensor-like histidine kinase SenX3 n=1 Tax=Nocardioides cavernae TaxID=1921566 RepID=A0A7Y9H1C7_9ACTN|nr:HAMP domain-containing sensor histidine kinase [Nocardioides cavernae]NYE36172.1 signal transduction histidine kinase [Nocardioides cavernae]